MIAYLTSGAILQSSHYLNKLLPSQGKGQVQQ